MSTLSKETQDQIRKEADDMPIWESITIEKFRNGDRIKFMTFTVKASEKSDLTKMIMDLLIRVTEHKGYKSYFDSKAVDPLASKETDSTAWAIWRQKAEVFEKALKEISKLELHDNLLSRDLLYNCIGIATKALESFNQNKVK